MSCCRKANANDEASIIRDIKQKSRLISCRKLDGICLHAHRITVNGIADDMQNRITTMRRASAIRTARTAVTGAQNAGRMDSYKAAEGMGIKLIRI